ncbi:MAG: hypothetical protein J6S49_06735 [Erysipelotrichaceae bacterium]|nr:hypothetical protein [Erysipelotrichaceae bacterium]
MSDDRKKCWLMEGCPSRTGACYSCVPDGDECPIWRWFKKQILLKEQEAKNGEWITIWQENDPDTSTNARCSICNRISERPLGGYCKWCGAKMSYERGIDG